MLDGLCHLLASENQGSGLSQHYMGSQYSQAARLQTLKCLLPFWLTSVSPKICTYKAHSFPFAQLSHNTPGWRQGKTSGKGFPLPQLQAQVWKLPQRPSQQRGTHPLWVLWLWWFTLCANLARLQNLVVWSNKSLNYIQPSTDFPTPTLPFLPCNPDTSIQPAPFEDCGVIVIIFGNKMLETSQPWPLPSL